MPQPEAEYHLETSSEEEDNEEQDWYVESNKLGNDEDGSDRDDYADDNTLSGFSNSFSNLIKPLENQSDMALSWLQNNKMIANPEKFHAIILTKDKKDNSNLEIRIGNKIIKSEPTVKLFVRCNN